MMAAAAPIFREHLYSGNLSELSKAEDDRELVSASGLARTLMWSPIPRAGLQDSADQTGVHDRGDDNVDVAVRVRGHRADILWPLRVERE